MITAIYVDQELVKRCIEAGIPPWEIACPLLSEEEPHLREIPKNADLPMWCFYQDEDYELDTHFSGDLAENPEQAVKVQKKIDDEKTASFRDGENHGYRRAREALHDLLGVNRIVHALKGGKG